MLAVLLGILLPRLSVRGRAWLERELASAAPGHGSAEVLRAFADAPRHAGRTELKLDDEESARIRAIDADLSLVHWTTDDAARAVLLLSLATELPAQFGDIAIGCYEAGDARAQQSWLRALPMLPTPERFLSTALDACRAANADVLESLACENPYPARHFPERNFNQLVMRALSSGVALSRIVGLASRLNADLARMAGDYAAERKAAGRSAPPDLSLVLTAGRIATAS